VESNEPSHSISCGQNKQEISGIAKDKDHFLSLDLSNSLELSTSLNSQKLEEPNPYD
jgi:hypothetical protein